MGYTETKAHEELQTGKIEKRISYDYMDQKLKQREYLEGLVRRTENIANSILGHPHAEVGQCKTESYGPVPAEDCFVSRMEVDVYETDKLLSVLEFHLERIDKFI